MKRKVLACLLVLSILFSGCVEPGPGPMQRADDSKATEEGVKQLVQGSNQFALELYKELDEEEAGNIFFSPWSMSFALGMTYEGAKGQTAEEMRSVLHFPADNTVRQSSFAAVYNLINWGNKPYTLRTANALWAQKDYPFLSEYTNLILSYYVGNATNLDFTGNPEGSRQTINSWVEEKTSNKIKDLIPPGVITPLTRLVLTNAIYFKGKWLQQFDPNETKEEDFTVSQGNTVRAEMMRLIGEDAEFGYAETDELQVLEMPYVGEELSMLVLLPKGNSLQALEQSLDADKLSELRNSLWKQRVDVYMPKFTFETKYMMADALKEMGMPTAFNLGQADFSGINGGQEDLAISQVIHQAFVEVNEEGTEAAAATAVVVIGTSMPPEVPEFRADNPFIFVIQERTTGSILFIGRVTDPTAQ